MDDDYTAFHIRYDGNLDPCSPSVGKKVDDVIDCILEFYKSSNTTSVAMSQGGDHIGSKYYSNGELSKCRLRRKCMNSWFCDTQKPFMFFGHMNEDVSAYVTYGRRGLVFFTVMQAMLVQKPTQVTAGGMSDLYLSAGTYAKSFYTVMAAPSCTQVGLMGDTREGCVSRIHHKINWNKAIPKIIDERHKKS